MIRAAVTTEPVALPLYPQRPDARPRARLDPATEPLRRIGSSRGRYSLGIATPLGSGSDDGGSGGVGAIPVTLPLDVDDPAALPDMSGDPLAEPVEEVDPVAPPVLPSSPVTDPAEDCEPLTEPEKPGEPAADPEADTEPATAPR